MNNTVVGKIILESDLLAMAAALTHSYFCSVLSVMHFQQCIVTQCTFVLWIYLYVSEHSFCAPSSANEIQRAYKNYKNKTCRLYSDHFICSVPALSLLFFATLLMILVCYYKGISERVTMQRTQQFSDFPVECSKN